MEDFQFKKGKMLFWRLGAINSVKQSHFGNLETHQPPTKRGLWCFPYPHYDYFFAFRQWELRLPKKFQNKSSEGLSPEQSKIYWEEYDIALKEVQKKYRPKTFWYGEGFYSHIGIHGQVDYENWFFWENPKFWLNEARKHIYTTGRFGEEIFKMKYAKDHLEIFIPNF